MIQTVHLRDAERVARALMILILLTAGTSKLFSSGGFADYYGQAFQGDLRIVLPPGLVGVYLMLIPFIEIGLGIALAIDAIRRPAVLAWFAFMASLMVGHYVLQEWSAVNDMLDYFFLGLLCWVLPAHPGWLGRDRSAAAR